MPRLEPVMTATWPERSNGVFFIVGCLHDFRRRHASEAKQSSFLRRGKKAGLLRPLRSSQ
jgi:hypothetical protein